MRLHFVLSIILLATITACGKAKSKEPVINTNEVTVAPKDANINELSLMIEKDANNPELYYYRGLKNGDMEDYTLAIQDFSNCIRLDSNNARAWFNRGASNFSLNYLNEALYDYNKAILLDPNYTDAYVNRGVLFDTKGEYKNAIPDYDKALQLKPDYWDAMYYRGCDYLLLDNDAKACDDFKFLAEKRYEDGIKAYDKYCLKKNK